MPSAGIEFVDVESVRREARALANRLRALYAEVREVLLIGSFAYGRPTPRSDIDLVVIVSDTPLSPHDRAQHYLPVHHRPVDMTVYTDDEVKAMRANPPTILRDALSRGIALL